VFGVIAHQLRRAALYGTLASLNSTSKSICYVTTPALLHTLFARWDRDLPSLMDMREFDRMIANQYRETYHHIR
jgi:hypothetical protein